MNTKSTLSILDASGDTRLTWDAASPEECEEMRKTVSDLKSRGYTFFLADGSPADEVGAGQGTLLVKRLTVDEVVVAMPAPEEAPPPSEPEKKRRGRPPKAKAEAAGTRQIVAVRPIQGG